MDAITMSGMVEMRNLMQRRIARMVDSIVDSWPLARNETESSYLRRLDGVCAGHQAPSGCHSVCVTISEEH